MESLIEYGLLLIGLVLTFYYYFTLGHDYWKSRKIVGPKPVAFFGTIRGVVMQKCTMGDYLTEIYKIYKKEPFVGIYVLNTPVLVLHDLDIIKNVLIKDFEKFADRGIPINEKIEPLSANLFNLESTRWRSLRHRFTPVFTSGKLKKMFYLLVECAENSVKYLEMKINDARADVTTIDCHEFAAKFTTDVIGLCAFGIETGATTSEKSPFREMGKRIFSTDWKSVLKFHLRIFSPRIFSFLGPLMQDREIDDFFINTMLQTMDYRKKNCVVKHDFVDLLMNIRDSPDNNLGFEMTDSLLAAQLFLFFLAGFETASSTMSNALYELALNNRIQERLRKEINGEMKRTGSVIEYDGINQMKYLDMVFQETLRKHATGTLLIRKSLEDYTIESATTKKVVAIEKGQRMFIPIYAIQRDPNYFPEPEVFDPERFNSETIQLRHPMTYVPFGDGPRNCIGKRFGVMQTKVGLVKILHRYRFEICDRTQIPYINDPKSIFLAPKNGNFLKVVRLDSYSTDL